jgi:hypothetical protein
MSYRRWIRGLQFVSIFLMWMFATAVLALIVWLILVAVRWQDALNWTVAISLVMAPVYLTVSGTLTYVFIGLMRGTPEAQEEPQATNTPSPKPLRREEPSTSERGPR